MIHVHCKIEENSIAVLYGMLLFSGAEFLVSLAVCCTSRSGKVVCEADPPWMA